MKSITNRVRLMAVASALAVAGFSLVVQAAPIGDAKAGKEKAVLCSGCHGLDGNSEDAAYPRLAGQYAGYIVKQIKDFQKGYRANNDTMSGMAEAVASEQDAKDIGSYYAQQEMKGSLTKPDKELVAAGEKLFLEGNAGSGVQACINCHGENGKGKSASVSIFPVVGGQHRDYLIKQLKDFRDDGRANDPAGMMTGASEKLSDQDIEALANYLSAQL